MNATGTYTHEHTNLLPPPAAAAVEAYSSFLSVGHSIWERGKIAIHKVHGRSELPGLSLYTWHAYGFR